MRWICKEPSRAQALELSNELGLSTAAAMLLCSLGFNRAEKARKFLTPRLGELEDPFQITHMKEAVERVERAMLGEEKVVVFGDYDVDGITSTVFLINVLKRFGLNPRHVVPLRMEEGYGLSMPALERLLEEGKPDLLIAVDCGTNSITETAWLRKKCVDIIVIDHHTSREAGNCEENALLINPHLYDGEEQPWSQLCTVGLIFKFVHALIKDLRNKGDELAEQTDIREYLDLVALGTVADLVPLLGENRILARKGLERISSSGRTGLEALLEVSGMEAGQDVTPFDISFRLSPRINASGRLADASLAVEMLLGKDWITCMEAAQTLDRMNRERQDIEREIAAEAIGIAEREFENCPAIVLYNRAWHPGVVGIVASRVSSMLGRPAIVLGSEDGKTLKGSGRSVKGVNLVEALESCKDLLLKWGGHPMAVGISLDAENLSEFRDSFSTAISKQNIDLDDEDELEISLRISPSELNEQLFSELDTMGPFGQGNPQPVLALGPVRLQYPATVFGSGHCRFNLALGNGSQIPCVAWRMADRCPPAGADLDIAAKLTWNVWKGKRLAQLQIEDWKLL